MRIRVTGSTLLEEDQLWVPASVSVFSGEEIRQMGIETMEELMDFVPGYQSMQQGESGQSLPYSSRGRKVGTTSREVLVLVDGHRVDSTFYGGGAFTMPLLSLGNVERIEFLRGPGSATYGTGAFLGTVNIVTGRGRKEVGASIGSNGRHDAHLIWSGGEGGFRYDFFVRSFEDDGERYNAYDSFNGRVSTRDAQGGDDVRMSLQADSWTFSYTKADRYADGFYVLGAVDDLFHGYDTQNQIASVGRTLDWNGKHSSELLFSYRKWSETVKTTAAAAGSLAAISAPSSVAPLYAVGEVEEDEISAFFVHNWQVDDQLELIAGVERREVDLGLAQIRSNYDIGEIANGSLPITYYGDFEHATVSVSTESRSIWGVFAQAKLQLGQEAQLTAGLRYDEDDVVGARISPRLGFVVEATPDVVFKILYSEAFRSPSDIELSTTNNMISIGNPKLKPEVVKTAEVVAIKRWGANLASVSLFSNEFEDSIVTEAAGLRRSWMNRGSESNSGLEFEFRTELAASLMLRTSLTHFLSSPASAFREAKWLGSIHLNYTLDRWGISLGTSYHGSRSMPVSSEDDLLKLDDYFKTTAMLRYSIDDRWSVFAKSLNVSDEDIRTPSQSIDLIEGIPNRGREIRVGFVGCF